MKNSRVLVVAVLAALGCSTTGTTQKTKIDEGTVWASHAFPTGRKSTSAVMLERGTPAQVPVGQPYEYELRVTNLTDHPLEDVVVNERVGDDLSVDSAEPAAASVTDGVASWELGTLGGKETLTIRVTATPKSTGAFESRCEIKYRSLLYGSMTVYEPKLALDRETRTDSLVGEPIDFRLTVGNPGTGPTRDVVVAGELPEGMETIDGEKSFRFEMAELAAGATKEYVVQVRGNATGDHVLVAHAMAKGDLRAEAQPAPLAVRRATLWAEAKGPAEWVLDREASYVITARNTGEGAARHAMLRLALPEGATFVRGSGNPTASADEVRWNLGTLEAGAEHKVEAVLQLSQGGELGGRVLLSASYCESVASEWATKVVGVAALAVEVSDAQDPIGNGAEQTYRVLVRNQGSAPGTDIRIVCLLEKTMEFVSAAGATSGAADGEHVTFEPLESLAPGATAEWTVVVRAVGVGDVRFKVSITSAETERPVEAAESTRFYGAAE